MRQFIKPALQTNSTREDLKEALVGEINNKVCEQVHLIQPLTIAEAARYYRMSERTIRRRIKDGTLQRQLGQGRLVRISVGQLHTLANKT